MVTSAAQDVLWRLHPTWGEWIASGWEPYLLDEAELWLAYGWHEDPARALRWVNAGVRDPRMARRYEDFGWTSPELFEVVSHLERRHNMLGSAAGRVLSANPSIEIVERYHRFLHTEDLERLNHDEKFVLFAHGVRWDAGLAGDGLSVRLCYGDETFSC